MPEPVATRTLRNERTDIAALPGSAVQPVILRPDQVLSPRVDQADSGRLIKQASNMPSLDSLLQMTVIVQLSTKAHGPKPLASFALQMWIALSVGGLVVGGLLVCSFAIDNFWLQPSTGLFISAGWLVLILTLRQWCKDEQGVR